MYVLNFFSYDMLIVSRIHSQADDTPMRTVKTVIHTLVKQQGESILGCLNRIQDAQASELVPYIR